MNEWFQRQFGDRSTFALCVSLGVDAHPSGDAERDATWGSLEVWAAGRCLTAAHVDGAVRSGVQWSLAPILRWLAASAVRLVNEEPFPFRAVDEVADACAWWSSTLDPPVLTPSAEREWFLARSAWRQVHALRRAAEDVALPNVVFRRFGEEIEISWDNAGWAPPRRGMSFLERRGRAFVDARVFARITVELLEAVTRALASRADAHPLGRIVQGVACPAAGVSDWRWLIHAVTADAIARDMPALRESLDRAARSGAEGVYVPHTPETLALRQVALERPAHIDAMLRLAAHRPESRMSVALSSLVRPTPPDPDRPWAEGNARAEAVREALGWGSDPLPSLQAWLPTEGVALPSPVDGLPDGVALVAARSDDLRALAVVNPSARGARPEMGLATALGHIVMDSGAFVVDGAWEHWPAAARARAFAVALALPEEGVRDALSPGAVWGTCGG